MDRNTSDPIAKIVCIALGCYMAYLIFLWLLPYLALGLALYGAGHLYLEYLKSNRHD